MTPKRAEESEEETKRIAREIADTLAALATPLPGSGTAAASRNAGGPDQFALDGPRAMLENGARFVAPVLPADARARKAKALALRALRIVTRDQTVFNSAVLEALRVAFREIEQGVEATRSRAAGRIDAVEVRFDEGLQRTSSDVLAESNRRIAAIDQTLATRLTAEAAAREVLGQESSAALTRVDRLEREADRRGADIDGVLAAATRSARRASGKTGGWRTWRGSCELFGSNGRRSGLESFPRGGPRRRRQAWPVGRSRSIQEIRSGPGST